MHQFELKTPVLFLVFNRPSTTKIVFEAIRNARPSKLYVVADGPRSNKPGEFEKCQEVRSIVTDIDWDCELKTLFRDENLGCGRGVSAGITWFFQNEPEGIVLEDDCYPHPTFFRYCSELLAHYRDDNRIMEISGNNLRPEGYQDNDYSYSFSNFNGIWGWASWRRAWNLYDFEMKEYKNVKQRQALENKYTSIYERDYFNWVFERTYLFPHITWDYQWEFVKRINSALTIIPKKNLVVNLGFGADATSTTSSDSPATNLKSEALDFPMNHPPFVLADVDGDHRAFSMYMTTVKSRLTSHIKALLPQKIRDQLFKKSMIRFIESQTSDPDRVRQLREKSPSKLFFFPHLALTLNAFEFEMECIFLVLI